MDLATLIGFIVAVGIIVAAMITGGGLAAFLDGPSTMIVVGGTLGAVMMNFTLGQFFWRHKDRPEGPDVQNGQAGRSDSAIGRDGQGDPDRRFAGAGRQGD